MLNFPIIPPTLTFPHSPNDVPLPSHPQPEEDSLVRFHIESAFDGWQYCCLYALC